MRGDPAVELRRPDLKSVKAVELVLVHGTGKYIPAEPNTVADQRGGEERRDESSAAANRDVGDLHESDDPAEQIEDAHGHAAHIVALEQHSREHRGQGNYQERSRFDSSNLVE